VRIATLNVCFGVRSRLAPAALRAAGWAPVGRDSGCGSGWRSASTASCGCGWPGTPVVVGNVHLTANRDGDWASTNRHHEVQRAQLSQVRQAMRSADPAVLTGDFNVTSGSPLYPSIVEGWRDPFSGTNLPTYQESMLPAGRRASRIDYILVRGVAGPVRTEVLFTGPAPLPHPDGRPALLSDHVGLLADLGNSGLGNEP
jgi:endonuclease/exonuclease/phosphatase family metal-dependent hydrolase